MNRLLHRQPLGARARSALLSALCLVVPLITGWPASARAQASVGLPSTNVAWQVAASDADVDKAFALARAQRKPVLVYWGATWCPPCNQLKATFFNRQDFAAQARHVVAVHVDGDRPGAQKLGARFKVRGYPTVILMSPDGAEITRLPGEADAPQILAALQAGLAGGRPIKQVLADARAGRSLGSNDWRMLAFYSWETDEAQLVSEADRPALLAELASKSPAADRETSTRLWLKALAASDDGKGLKPDASLRARVDEVLADPVMARTHMDVLIYGADDMVKVLTDAETPQRAALTGRFDGVLQRLQADASLSRGDRLSALLGRVNLARLGVPKAELRPTLPEALQREVRDMSTRLDREVTDGYERQSVITAAAYVLGQAGLWTESDALLKANLTRSHSPYYLMSQLGSNARKQGRTVEALQWYEQAFDKSVGPATRLQWGAAYFSALIELAPTDVTRVESLATQLFKEAAADPAAFHERSARSLQRVGTQLLKWNGQGQHKAVLERLQSQLDRICGQRDAADGQRANCQRLLKSA
jgi:thiol-disulfide isomerase/thioredoxin